MVLCVKPLVTFSDIKATSIITLNVCLYMLNKQNTWIIYFNVD